MNQIQNRQKSAQIVIVDDDEMFRESLIQNLSDAGYSTRAFDNGSSALSHLAISDTPDMILLDWKMPGLTGIETRQWFASWLPHSVTATRFHMDGKLYLGSGYPAGIKLPNGRHWNRNLLANPYVRVRIAGKIYEGHATYIEDGPERQALIRKYGPMFWSPGFYLHVWRVDPVK